jgi:hypothetical protein
VNALKKWLLEKAAVETLERQGRLPEGTGKLLMGYTLYSFTPSIVKTALPRLGYSIAGRLLPSSARIQAPGTELPHAPKSIQGPRIRSPPRVGGGRALAIPALNLGLGIMVAGAFNEWYESTEHYQLTNEM